MKISAVSRVGVAVVAAVTLAVGPLASVSDGTSAGGAEVTLVHAFASVPREAGGPTGPDVDVYIDDVLAASSLGFAESVTLPQRVLEGEYQLRLTQAGQSEPELQDQQITIPQATSVDVAVGRSPAGGAGLPFASVFVNDLAPTPAGSTGLVLRNVSDDPAVSLLLFGPPTPAELTGVAKGEEGAADVQAIFSEMRLVPTTCADLCSVLFMQEFPAGVRTIVYAVGLPGNVQTGELTLETSSFDGVNRALVVGEQPVPSPSPTPSPSPSPTAAPAPSAIPSPSPTAKPLPTAVPTGAEPTDTPVSLPVVGAVLVLAVAGGLGLVRARRVRG